MNRDREERFTIPGTAFTFQLRHNEMGELIGMRHDARVYLSCRDGAPDVSRRCTRHNVNMIVGGWIENGIDGPVRCARPATVDQHFHKMSSRRCADMPGTANHDA